MRITEIYLQCEDIMWFGVDNSGSIFECTSAGCGNVPEYVCRSLEETQKLLKYFTQEAKIITTPILLIPESNNQLSKDIKDLSSKGIYCFDVTDYDNYQVYNRIAKPKKPLKINDLPVEIQTILADHKYDGDVSLSDSISVKHAY